MKCTIHYRAANSLRRCCRCARMVAVICGTIVFVSVISSAHGQTSKAQSGSVAGEWKSTTVSDMPTPFVHVASNQKLPATNSPKPPAAPAKQPTRKPATKKAVAPDAADSTPPDDGEELP